MKALTGYRPGDMAARARDSAMLARMRRSAADNLKAGLAAYAKAEASLPNRQPE